MSAVFLCLPLACTRAAPEPPPAGPDPAMDPFQDRAPSGFRVTLLLAAQQLTPTTPLSACQLPIQEEGTFLLDRPPEAGLVVRAPRSPGDDVVLSARPDGLYTLSDLALGFHALRLELPGTPLSALLAVNLTARRTDVRGFVWRDEGDLDLDGDRDEWVLAASVLPDDDGDRVSDDGTRIRGVFGADGGRVFRHLGGGRSEIVELDQAGVELRSNPVDDRDGDFVPDATDPDDDGDGLEDATNPPALPCPSFSHDELFVPQSAHKDFDCRRCHEPPTEPPLRCSDCHAADGRAYNQTPANPPADHFQRGCELCHGASSPWADKPGASGEHHLAFALTGVHRTTDCFSCHLGGKRKPTSTCESCHLDDAAVGHHQTDCIRCHDTRAWKPAAASHEHFPLTGGHAAVDCASCHGGGQYQGLSKACASCHADDAPPKHGPAGFSADPCENCHQLSAFADYRYTHPAWTLNASHQTLACGRCHDRNPTDYRGNAQACATCHSPPAFPDHSDATQFGTACELCHDEASFVPATRGRTDHTVFPLEGSHTSARCGSCHDNGQRLQPPRDCTSCHDTERPARHSGFFDGDCGQCHRPTSWAELSPPHVHTASFPLMGVHATTPCARCHQTSYRVSSACIDCHLADRPPNHYGDDCQSCHTSADWNPTGMQNHHAIDPNALPLTGGHGGLLCSQCHTGGFTALPRACDSCHQSDAPLGHASNGCDRCHAVTAWSSPTAPSNNALHPLIGGHANRRCDACHGAYAGTNFATPSPGTACAGCHTVNTGHIDVGTTACDSCHTVQAWTPAQGGHAGAVPTTPFPYNSWSGRWLPVPHHSARRCNQCHTRTSDPVAGFHFYSCTTNCHTNNSGLTNEHRGEHLFHFDPNAQNNPPNEGGATWPTGHVGCVKSNCHADGRN